MAAIAACNNVYLKLGGIGMPMMGFRWDKRDKPATSAELAEAWSDPIQYAIEVLGRRDACLSQISQLTNALGMCLFGTASNS